MSHERTAVIDVRTRLAGAWSVLGARDVGSIDGLAAMPLHPLAVDGRPLLAALDAKGLRHILVPLPPHAAAIEDTRSAGVALSTRTWMEGSDGIRYSDLVCLRSDLAGVFEGLAADVCMGVVRSDNPGLLVAQRLDAWRELFEAPAPRWTPERLAGLAAELTVLRGLLELDPSASAAWSGPLGEAQDFRLGSHAIEVKATLSPEARLIAVHGWDQLEPPAGGDLSLGWFRLRPGSSGLTVPELARHCLQIAASPADVQARIDRLGMPASDTPVLATRFEIVEERWYEVDGSFPAVVPASFRSGHVPAGVVSLEYRIDLDGVPFSSDVRDAFLVRFLELV
jgi:hypothetical protein